MGVCESVRESERSVGFGSVVGKNCVGSLVSGTCQYSRVSFKND